MTVRKKGNKWYCRFQVDGIRYERRCALATDKLSAIKSEAVIKTEIMRGNYNFAKSKKKLTLGEALELFEKHSKANKLTYKNDLIMINKIIEYFGKNKVLESITTSEINTFKSRMKLYKVNQKKKIKNPEYGKRGIRKQWIYKVEEIEKERSNATINRYVSILSKMFNLLISEEKITHNPCTFSSKLRENNFKIRYLTEEEQERLFLNLNKEQYKHIKSIVICALYTGMRIGEIFSLKWEQIDFKNDYISVLKSKSGKERKIPILEKLEQELLTIPKKSKYVFVNSETGLPYKDIKHSFHSLLKDSKITNFRFHDFRHTVATRLVESGVDLLVVQEILGHSNIQTTMRYAHPVPERKKQAISLLNSF